MKRVLSFVLVLVLIFSVCGQAVASSEEPEGVVAEFRSLSDPQLLQYTEDQIYAGLVDEFDSEDYIIENVQAVYISKEYLEEFAYNSKSNIFFGYTLEELDEEFQDTAYIFTLGEDGSTVVQPFEDYDDTYDRVIRNVAIGSGIILVCVTVSVVTGGAGLATTSMIFAASAKTGTTVALSSGMFSAVFAGALTGYQTGDFDEAIKAGALKGSESFMWGAISGAAIGGLTELSAIRRTAKAVEGATEYLSGEVEIPSDAPQWRQAELRELNNGGGYDQLSYKNGQLLLRREQGATRPDVVRTVGDHLEAIEVKYYDISNPSNMGTMRRELMREIPARIENLPKGSTQRIVLDVTNRGFGAEVVDYAKESIRAWLKDIYPNIPIDVVGMAA